MCKFNASGVSMTLVREVLRGKPPGAWTVGPDATVYEALELMADKDIGALPVMDGDRLIGIVSERDYARKVILQGRFSRETLVADIMSPHVITIQPGESMETCMALMTHQHVRHLPVLEDEHLLGIISIGDVLKAIINDQQILIHDMESYITGASR
jgi:CBS domain-containing protein